MLMERLLTIIGIITLAPLSIVPISFVFCVLVWDSTIWWGTLVVAGYYSLGLLLPTALLSILLLPSLVKKTVLNQGLTKREFTFMVIFLLVTITFLYGFGCYSVSNCWWIVEMALAELSKYL